MSREGVQIEAREELMMMEKESSEEEVEGRSTSRTTSSGGGGRNRRREVVRLKEYFLGMAGGSLRVLLLEGDDSTRHIIAALLRKCNYKVTAVSDGLKAWEILKEKPHSINIVLTEVELPLISGISLLSMIMDHESCKNIPVIMMSSNDSINMVFKCMLKGAADFLVKPVRKNELRNLWQHVWRKHTISDDHGGTKGHNDDNAKNKLEANPCKEKKPSGFLHPVKINNECSEKGSGAESSCRRSDMEAESTNKHDSTEPEQIKCGGLSPLSDTICQNDEERNQPNGSLLGNEIKDEDCSSTFGSEFTLFNGGCLMDEQILEEEHPCALIDATDEDMKPIESTYDNNTANRVQTCYQSSPKQIIDLIGAINNRGPFGYGLGQNTSSSNNLNDSTEVVFHGEDFSCKSSSSPMLELSLSRYPYSTAYRDTIDECSILNHSNSSPFSLYDSRTPVPPLSRTVILEGEGEEYYIHSTKQIPDKGFGNSSNVLGCNGTAQNIEVAEPPCFGASTQVGNTVKCPPIQEVIPVPVRVGGMDFDIGARYHAGMQSGFYPDPSAHLFWRAFHSEGQKAICRSSSRQSGTRDLLFSLQHPHDRTPKSPILDQIEHWNAEFRDEGCHVPSVTGNGANGSTCQTESNGLGRISHESETAELQNQEEKKPAEPHRLNSREAALNKFRLKRKDRCYEKKVRYQSRKKLAEERPRVKGQFVRHVQLGALLASTDVSGLMVPADG